MIHPHLVQPVEKWGGGSAGCGGLDKPSRSTIDMRLMAQYVSCALHKGLCETDKSVSCPQHFTNEAQLK